MHIKTQESKKHKKNVNVSAADYMPKDTNAQQILAQRAKLFAKEIIKKSAATNLISYVQFHLGPEQYGIPYQMAKEVIHKGIVTLVPFVPDYIVGVINRRGVLLTILDLKKFLRIPSSKDDLKAHILVINYKDITMGILVDSIDGNDTYDPMSLDAALSAESTIKSEYILGLHHGVIGIINVEAIILDLELQLIK